MGRNGHLLEGVTVDRVVFRHEDGNWMQKSVGAPRARRWHTLAQAFDEAQRRLRFGGGGRVAIIVEVDPAEDELTVLIGRSI